VAVRFRKIQEEPSWIEEAEASRGAVASRARELSRAAEERYLETGRHSYAVVANILGTVAHYVEAEGVAGPGNTMMAPGALYIARKLITGDMTIDQAASIVERVERRAWKLYTVLAGEKAAEVVVPRDASRDLQIGLWVDDVSSYRRSRLGGRSYALVILFGFPYDVHRYTPPEVEPVVFIFECDRPETKCVPTEAYARVHYNVYRYSLEGLDRVRVVFFAIGHTPKVVGAAPEAEGRPGILREAVDRLWLELGDWITRLAPTDTVSLASVDPSRAYLAYRVNLPPGSASPWVSKVYPYDRLEWTSAITIGPWTYYEIKRKREKRGLAPGPN